MNEDLLQLIVRPAGGMMDWRWLNAFITSCGVPTICRSSIYAYNLTDAVADSASRISLIPNENNRLLRGSPCLTPLSDDRSIPLLVRNSNGDGVLYAKCT